MLNLTYLRIALNSWARKLKQAYDTLLASLKQTRENLHQSFRDEQQDVERQIYEILVNLRDWQRIGFKKAIQILETLLTEGTDRQIELQMGRIANLITYRWSVGSLHPIRGAYKYLSTYQESLVWRFITAFKKWFATGVKEVKEAVADLDCVLALEEPVEETSALREDAISWAINQAGEIIQQRMPTLFPFTSAPFCFRSLLSFFPRRQSWDEWEAKVWRAVSKFRQGFEWARC